MTDKQIDPPYKDDLTIREAYAETVQVNIDSGGLIRIELCVYRLPTKPPVFPDRLVPVARAAMPVGLAKILRDQLTNSIEAFEKNVKLAQAPAASPTKN